MIRFITVKVPKITDVFEKNIQTILWMNNAECSLINFAFQTVGYFTYVDGWHMTISNWYRKYPSTDQDCVFVDVDGKWKTAYCNQTMNSICMMSTGASHDNYDAVLRPNAKQIFITIRDWPQDPSCLLALNFRPFSVGRGSEWSECRGFHVFTLFVWRRSGRPAWVNRNSCLPTSLHWLCM